MSIVAQSAPSSPAWTDMRRLGVKHSHLELDIRPELYDTWLSCLVEAAKHIDLPVLLIRGRASDVVTEVQVEEFLQLIPHAEFVDVDKARHMVAGDRNDIFTDAVLAFLSRQRLSRQEEGAA